MKLTGKQKKKKWRSRYNHLEPKSHKSKKEGPVAGNQEGDTWNLSHNWCRFKSALPYWNIWSREYKQNHSSKNISHT